MKKIMTVAMTIVMVAATAGALILSPKWLQEHFSSAEPTERRGGGGRAQPVVLTALAFESERTRIEAVGTARALRSVTLYPAATGEVVAVNFRAGQRVAAGDDLLELDRQDAELALALAGVRVAEAERLLTRYERSEGSGAFPLSTVDSARSALAAARIERQRAEVALADRLIKAPFSGFVGITEIEPGDRIGPDTAITTLDDRSELLVNFEVPELFFDRIGTGETLAIATWATRAVPIQGHIHDVGTRIDPASRTFVVRAKVPNPDDRLRPGMSFRVELNLEGDSYPVVPEVAVQWGGDGAYIWVVRDGRAQRVGIDIVQRRAGRVLVTAPLEDGIPVVVEGVQRLRQGQTVSPLDSEDGGGEEGDKFLARRGEDS